MLTIANECENISVPGWNRNGMGTLFFFFSKKKTTWHTSGSGRKKDGSSELYGSSMATYLFNAYRHPHSETVSLSVKDHNMSPSVWQKVTFDICLSVESATISIKMLARGQPIQLCSSSCETCNFSEHQEHVVQLVATNLKIIV